MLEELGYRGPQLIRAALEQVFASEAAVAPRGERQLDVLDLGCGTGMMAAALDDWTAVVHGVDISAQMVERARARGVYEMVHLGDVERFLQRRELGLPSYDLIVAADVLVYIGDLTPLFSAVGPRLSRAGVFVFSVEHADGEPFTLGATGRYAHDPGHVRGTAESHGLTVVSMQRCSLRTEAERPVQSLIFVLAPV